jgi:hypothetical protein
MKRRIQLLDWVCSNFARWPAPFDTAPEGPDAGEVAAEWQMMQEVSSLPVLRCRLGGCGPITSTDYFYHKRYKRSNYK